MINSIRHHGEAAQKVNGCLCLWMGEGHSEEQQVLSSHWALAKKACKTTAPAKRHQGRHVFNFERKWFRKRRTDAGSPWQNKLQFCGDLKGGEGVRRAFLTSRDSIKLCWQWYDSAILSKPIKCLCLVQCLQVKCLKQAWNHAQLIWY